MDTNIYMYIYTYTCIFPLFYVIIHISLHELIHGDDCLHISCEKGKTQEMVVYLSVCEQNWKSTFSYFEYIKTLKV